MRQSRAHTISGPTPMSKVQLLSKGYEQLEANARDTEIHCDPGDRRFGSSCQTLPTSPQPGKVAGTLQQSCSHIEEVQGIS